MQIMQKLCDLQITQTYSGYSHVLIGGDFNYPKIDWITRTTSKQVDHHSKRFLDIYRDICTYFNRYPNQYDLDMVKKKTCWISS